MGAREKLKGTAPKVLNAWLLFVTVLVIVLSFLYYSFVFVKNNEKDQVANRFRVLAQVGKNVVEREKGFRGIVGHAVKEAIKQSGSETPREEYLRDEITKANDSLRMEKIDKEESFQKKRVRFSPQCVECKDKDGKIEYYIYMNAKDFFEPLKRPDVFDELIVLQEVEDKKVEILYHTFAGDIVVSQADKLKNSQQGIASGCLKEIEISNIKYKLFLQPVRLDSGEKWCVAGLIADKKFTKESRKLRAGVLTPLLIVFSIFLLSIPILKIFLMSRFEQLNISDVVLTTVSVNFGTIALLLLFVYTFQVTGDRAVVQTNLKNLADQIKTNFTKELGKAYRELECYDSSEFLLNYSPVLGDSFENILTDSQIPNPAIYPFFKGVFWMDRSGQQVLQFSTRKYGGRLINLNPRNYFQEAGNWNVPGSKKADSKFMLESITSMTSGENLAAISMKSDFNLRDKEGKPVKAIAAMTTQLTSVIDTIMPAGYGFCIIDKTGEVWFHSNTRRNHQENFFHEVENDKALLSAVSANREKHMLLDYQDKTHKCFEMPVPDIPLYIVTFHDLRYTTAVQVTIILHIVLFFIALALFIGLLFIAAACCNYRKSLLRRKHVPFEWFKPLIKNRDAYEHLILSNLVIVIFLILFKLFARTPAVETLFLCLSAILYSFIYNYYTIAGEDGEKYRLKNIRLSIFFLFFIFLLDLAAVLIVEKFTQLLWFQTGLFFFLGLTESNRAKFKPFEFLHSGHIRNWLRSYVLFLLSWLLVVAVIPVILYYLDVHDYENKVALKHFQAKLAERIETRDFEIDDFYEKKIGEPGHPNVMRTKSSRKRSGIYAGVIGDTEIEDAIRKEIKDAVKKYESANSLADTTFNQFASVIKPPLHRVAAERGAFVFPAASDNSFTWKKKDNKLILKYQKKRFPFADTANNKDEQYVYVESDMTYFKISIRFALLLAAAAIFLLLAYFLMRFAARMLFGLNIPGLDNIKRTYSEAQYEIFDSIKAGTHVIIYCPGSLEMRCCEDALNNPSRLQVHYTDHKGKSKPKKIDTVDLKSGSGALAKISESSKERLIIIKNFELHSNDTDKYIQQMNRVVSLLRSRNCQLVVLASMPLEAIIESYEEKLEEASSKEASSSEKEMRAKYKEIIDGLNEINEGLLPMHLPLKTTAEESIKDQSVYPGIENIPDAGMRDLIIKEFQAAEYCKKIAPGVYRYHEYLQRKNIPISEAREEMIIKIQELTQQYYNELLSSCSKKEKYILYDIAQDMFVNVNNLDAINTLLRKGLLVYNGEFKLMNESFRNFILCTIDGDELKQYVRTLYPKWRSYKAPLLFIALGVAVFLAFQGDLLGKVDALVATAIGGVAIVTNFSRLFLGYSKSSSK